MDMGDLPPETMDWMKFCSEHEDKLLDNDDDWQALKGALLDTLPLEPVDLFADLGLSLKDASFDETSRVLDYPPGSYDKSSGDMDPQYADPAGSLADGGAENHKIHNRYDSNGSKASTSHRNSNSFDSDEETDDQKDDEVLKICREMGKMNLRFRGKEYALVSPIDDEDTSDGKAAFLTEDTENIFRVWDLEISEEEDELTKQLGRALEKSNDNELYKQDSKPTSLEDKELDDLVAGLEELSLQTISSDKLR